MRIRKPKPGSKEAISPPELTALKEYGVDLTELASKGKLDPVIGREEEIRRTIQVLSRRTKNKYVYDIYTCFTEILSFKH